MTRIREVDLQLARSRLGEDPLLDRRWKGPEAESELFHNQIDQAQAMGLELVVKSSFWGSLSVMSTTYFKQIRLGNDWSDLSRTMKVVLLAHELRHARQWREYGRATFRTNYLFQPRWRWAVEVQGYCESVRTLVALGASPDWIEQYIDHRVGSLWKKYALKTIRKDDLFGYSKSILMKKVAVARAIVGE